MEQAQQHPKRDMLAIMLRILDIANEPVKKTHILYSAGINFYQLSRYLNFLLKLGLLEELSEPYVGYRTTEKGRACLRLFNSSDLDSVEIEGSIETSPPKVQHKT
ncbi:MAG: winged helix-turn-helix domain-containing protein [Nitrososphaera sp.]|nr:winged helix-turn-helix domain-containing protein [Nitrososphaera sp.]